MTSINLVSPSGNGHTYSVKFRDPIVIEPNSSVYLNFAKFKRNSNLYFTTDQTIDIVINEVKPSIIPATGETNLATLTINIPSLNPLTGRTGYTAKELEALIYDKIRDLQLGTGVVNQLLLYSPIYNRQSTDVIEVGLYQDVDGLDAPTRRISLDPNNILSSSQGNNNEFGYIKTSNTDANNPYYDSYALSKEHYNFFYSPTLGAFDRDHNIIHFKTNVPVDSQLGNISIGLSSSEVGDVGGIGWTDYATDNDNIFTHGNIANQNTANATAKHNPALFIANQTNCLGGALNDISMRSAILGSYLTMEITGANHPTRPKQLILWRAINYSAAGSRLKLSKPDSVMNRMTEVWSTPLSNVLGTLDATTTKVELAFQTYWGNDFSAKKGGRSEGNDKLNFRIYNQTQSSQLTADQIIYDSYGTLNWLYYSFFNRATTGTIAEQGGQANSQIPFNLIMSAQCINEGFDFIKMDGFDKEGTYDSLTASDTNPISYIVDYKLNMSTEIATYLGQGQSVLMNPNADEAHADRILKHDAEQHEDESYSIFLKNFPISAYKNIQSKSMGSGGNVQDGGYVQPILYDVPTPYSDAKVINVGTGDILVGTFQPAIIKKLTLKNQKMVLNNIDVEIRDIETNEIAKGLTGSVINFTIE